MQFHVGTSGYSFKEWKGSFYPEKLPAKQMLSFYSSRFSTVEMNGTFYKLPAPKVSVEWAAEVPDTFRFVVKASKFLTHIRRLKNFEEPTDRLLTFTAGLEKRLGAILFQLPPNMKQDLPLLDAFLTNLGNRAPAVFEFRHESWLDQEVYACLKEHKCALCVSVADDDAPRAPLLKSASFGYVRLRSEGYTDVELKTWIKDLRAVGWKECYVFFKHEDSGTGPKLATRFLELAGE